MNLHIKRPRITVNLRIGPVPGKWPFLNRTYAKSQIKRSHIMRDACIYLFTAQYKTLIRVEFE